MNSNPNDNIFLGSFSCECWCRLSSAVHIDRMTARHIEWGFSSSLSRSLCNDDSAMFVAPFTLSLCVYICGSHSLRLFYFSPQHFYLINMIQK